MSANKYAIAVSKGATEVKNDRPSLADSVGDAGFAREALGTSLIRVRGAHDHTSYKTCLDLLIVRARSRAKRNRRGDWRQHDIDRIPKMCEDVLKSWLGLNACRTCEARGRLPVPGAEHVLNLECPACEGSGVRNKGAVSGRMAEIQSILDVAYFEAGRALNRRDDEG